jgi:hypothetical protein
MVSLKNVSDGGKGSKLTRTVAVKLTGQDVSPGSCKGDATSVPTDLSLYIEDDDGDVVIDTSKGPFTCGAGKITHVKFGVRYKGPENCAGSAVPSGQVSNGDLFVTASTLDGQLDDTLRIQCKR